MNETGARATLAGKSIALDLPFTVPAPERTRVSAWLLSPDDLPNSALTLDVAAGARSAHFTFLWPVDARGNAVEEIGWYRIGYRIDVNGAIVANGILSIGAITPNLLELKLARPQYIQRGMPISVRVFAGNPVTQKPYRSVRLKATLTFDDDSNSGRPAPKPLIHSAVTNTSGEAIFNLPALSEPGESATLDVEGTLAGNSGAEKSALAQASIESDLELNNRVMFSDETDKPLHKPGEVVHLRSLVFDDSHHALANVPLTLVIKDPDNKTLLEEPLKTNRFGIAFYDWKTSPQLAPGDYTADFDGDGSVGGYGSSMSLTVERYELPEFKVTATMDRPFYLAGQSPVVKIHTEYLFGKPVAEGTIKLYRLDDENWYARKKQIGNEAAPFASGTLDANGDASFTLDVKSDFADLSNEDYQRYTDLAYRAVVTDSSTGRSEPIKFMVRLTRDPVHVYLSQPLGDDREGDVIVSTSYADGTPVSCKIELDWMDENSKPTRATTAMTNRFGLAKVHLRYPAIAADAEDADRNLRVIARDPEGRLSTFDDTLRPQKVDVWLSVERSLLRPQEPIELTVHGKRGDVIDLDVVSETAVLAHLQVRMHDKSIPVTIPADARFHGLVAVRAYKMTAPAGRFDYWDEVLGSRLVLYPEDRSLRLSLSGMKPNYLPGAEVNTGLRLRDASGAAVDGAIGVTVFDNAVAQRAATEENENNWWFSYWWSSDSGSAGGVTRDDLNKVDTSKEIPADLELAAEALLLNSNSGSVEIEGTSDDAIRQEYRAAMEKHLEPLGKAIVAVADPHLPRTLEAVEQVARGAGFDPALLDPWSTQYRVQASKETPNEVVTFHSAGPDKIFGDDDDIYVDVAKRNLFAVPGAKLNKLLLQAVQSGQPLPANPEQLSALAAAGGIDLDSEAEGTLTPTGKPYKYDFVVQRRIFYIDALLPDDTHVWTSDGIDYFSPVETRIDAALKAWEAAGHAFPSTVDQALQLLSNAGIDPKELHDPLGRQLVLRVRQLLAYTRTEEVKAGEHLQVKAKPVTQLMRAIQIVRSPSAALGETMDTADVVAQFLHPISEQSGSDLTPEAVDQGTFNRNTGAIGGSVTDPTGAVISNAVVTVQNAAGEVSKAVTLENGMYLVSDLMPGVYSVHVQSRGFMDFELHEVHVSAVSLTTVDVTLSVGATTETVEVSANTLPVMTTESLMASVPRGFLGPDKKTVVTGPGGRAEISEPTFTPRLRHVFDETAYWAPSLETGAGGRAALKFNLPDSLTTWQLHALASTVDGRVGALESNFKTFQPFFIDLDTPQVLTIGDEITLPVNLRNYTAQSLTLPVAVKAADWFQALSPTAQRVTVPAGNSAKFNFGFRAQKSIDEGPLQITAANSRQGDAVEKKLRVHPDGEPQTVFASGLLRMNNSTLNIDLPANLIPGSLRAQLLIYPNMGAQLVHSIEAAIERPWGCGEQTISSTYPSLLFIELLHASKASSPLEDKAQANLQLGYDRLLNYFDANGGLTYWGENDHNPDPALTAYGVQFLTEARPFVKVDAARIADAVAWLISVQQKDGSWKPHYGEPNSETTLYIAWALAQTDLSDGPDAPKGLRDRTQVAVRRALEWVKHSVAAVHDPFANAILLQIASAEHDEDSAKRYHDELLSTANRDRNGARWSRGGQLPFYGWGRAGDFETTAMAFAALRAQGVAGDQALLNDVLYFLLGGRDEFGIWYSGQATVRVLKALLPIAEEEIAAPPNAAMFTLDLNGAALDSGVTEDAHGVLHGLNAPRTLDLTNLLKPGNNSLSITGEGDVALASAEVTAWFYTPWPASQPSASTQTATGKDYGLNFNYKCATDDMKIGQPVNCTVDARRFGSAGYGMLLAEAGLPPGADVDRASLGKLLDDGTISRYELEPDRVVFYLWPWRAEGSHFSFRFSPRYAIRAKAAPASLTDYYNPDLQVTLAPQVFEVN
ncbi:MAG TPA: alpha-2-macroglobulin family protein [Terracidiphilus sp.]|nr:alpha-2-macroglobulin family protein [Terracidiphilus sp.]